VGGSVRKSTSKIAHGAFTNVVQEKIDINRRVLRKSILAQLKFLEVPGKPYRVTDDTISAGLIDQCMKSAGYEIKEKYVSDQLKSFIYERSDEGDEICFSLHDWRAFVKRLNGITGRRFKIPTETEWLKAFKKVGKDFFGDDYEWTDTKVKRSPFCVLRSMYCSDRIIDYPEVRYSGTSIRLVEYKYFRPLSSLLRWWVNFKFKEVSPEKI
jgi:hypothetical protein